MFSEKEDIRTYHNLTGSEQFLEEEQEAKVKFFYVVYEAHTDSNVIENVTKFWIFINY